MNIVLLAGVLLALVAFRAWASSAQRPLRQKTNVKALKATRTVESDFDTPDDYAENPVAANPSQNSGGLALASNREPSADLA